MQKPTVGKKSRYPLYKRCLRWVYYHSIIPVKRSKDFPKSIARGVAAGMFITCTPTPGLQFVLSLLLATLIRGNRVLAVAVQMLSNPLTVIPIAYVSYRTGCFILAENPLTFESFKEVATGSFWEIFKKFVLLGVGIAVPLWVGAIIIGLIAATLAYLITLHLVTSYQKHRAHKIAKVAMRRQEEQKISKSEAQKPLPTA